MYPRTEMLDLIVIDGRARGIVTRNLITGKIESHLGDAVVLGTGGYGNVYYLSTNAKGSQRHRHLARAQARRAVRQSLLHADSPHLHSGLGRLPVEAHADERIAAQRRPRLGAGQEGRQPAAQPDSGRGARLLPGAALSELRQPGAARRGFAQRQDGLRRRPRRGRDGPGGLPRFPRRHPAARQERHSPSATATCSTCTSASPARIPTRCPCASIPAIHYTMGGLWVDYNLMSTIPGLYVIGEANFSDHGANRLGASALMQGLADGYFVLPNTIGDYLATNKFEKLDASHPAVREAESQVTCVTQAAAGDQGNALGGFLPPRAGQADVGLLRHVAHGRRAEVRAGADSRAARAVLERCEGAGNRRRVEPVAREGRPRGRFLRARRADVPRRAGAQRILRRPFPRGVPDPGRRSAARRRALFVRGGLGVPRRGQAARCCTRNRSLSSTCTRRNGATSNANHSPHLAAAERQREGPHGAVRGPQRQRAHVLPGDARRAERRPDREGRRPGGLRPRLPRGHLRHVRLHGERRGARPAARHHPVPAPHAALQRWRRAVPGAVAGAWPSRS